MRDPSADVEAVRQRGAPQAPPPLYKDLRLFVRVLRGDFGRDIDEWMHAHETRAAGRRPRPWH